MVCQPRIQRSSAAISKAMFEKSQLSGSGQRAEIRGNIKVKVIPEGDAVSLATSEHQ